MHRTNPASSRNKNSQEDQGEDQPKEGLLLGLGKDYWVLIVSVLIANVMSVGFFYTYIWIYLTREMQIPATMIGLATSFSTAITVIFSPFGGYASDVFGRRRMLLIGPLVAGVGWVVLWLGRGWQQSLLGFLILYIPAIFTGPALQAYIADVVDRNKLGRAYGTLSSVLNVCSFVGPGVVAFIINSYGQVAVINGYRMALLVTAIATFASAASRLLIRETITPRRSMDHREIFSRIFLPLKSRLMRPVTLVRIVYVSVWSSLYFFFLLFMRNVLQFDESTIGVIQMVRSGSFILMSPIGGRLAEKYSKRGLACINILGRAAFLFLLLNYNSFWQLMPLVLFESAVTTFLDPVVNSILGTLARKEERGAVFGSLRSLVGVAGIPTPTILGVLWDSGRYADLFYGPSAILLALAVYAVIAIPRDAEIETYAASGQRGQ